MKLFEVIFVVLLVIKLVDTDISYSYWVVFSPLIFKYSFVLIMEIINPECYKEAKLKKAYKSSVRK